MTAEGNHNKSGTSETQRSWTERHKIALLHKGTQQLLHNLFFLLFLIIFRLCQKDLDRHNPCFQTDLTDMHTKWKPDYSIAYCCYPRVRCRELLDILLCHGVKGITSLTAARQKKNMGFKTLKLSSLFNYVGISVITLIYVRSSFCELNTSYRSKKCLPSQPDYTSIRLPHVAELSAESLLACARSNGKCSCCSTTKYLKGYCNHTFLTFFNHHASPQSPTEIRVCRERLVEKKWWFAAYKDGVRNFLPGGIRILRDGREL